MNRARWLVVALVAALVAAFFLLDLHQYVTLERLQAERERLLALREANPWSFAGGFFLIYVLVTGLSLPGAAVLTLIAGALFGVLLGTVLVSFASTLGATAAFLLARFVFRDAVRARFPRQLAAIDRGMARDGAYYLLSLRLVPLFPYFLINLAMGLTPIRAPVYFLVSQIGMLPATVIFVNAGTQLAQVRSVGGVLSADVVTSLILLALFPLLARWLRDRLRERRALAPYERPARFDRNLVVIGAGSAGLVSAYIAAAVKAGVSLIERSRMGGDCLNTGCVPSKALIRSARVIGDARRAEQLGFRSIAVDFDFAEVMDRVQGVIRQIAPHDSVERYTELGVECVSGEARVRSPWEVEVGGRVITTRAIVVATGAKPLVPPIPGINEVHHYTSDTIWSLRELPRRLLVLGGGPIGCELAQCFARFGAETTIVDMAPSLLPREDGAVSAIIETVFAAEGIHLLTGHEAVAFSRAGGEQQLECRPAGGGEQVVVPFDAVLVALGRTPGWSGMGLEALGVEAAEDGTIAVNDYLQTRIPTIYACGDVAGPYQFTHFGAHQAWYATVNALFGQFKRFRVDYSVVPATTFTEPEVARVGLNEKLAAEQHYDYELTEYDLRDLDRVIAEGAEHGTVRVLTRRGSDRILGASIVGPHAGEMLTEFVTAMKAGRGLNSILGTIHAYPTLSEANKYAAGVWKRAHQPERLLAWIGRYHRWRRGGSGEGAAGAAAGREAH